MRAPVPQSAMAPMNSSTQPKTAMAAMKMADDASDSVTDPACGMPLSAHDAKASKYTASYQGHKFVFCSEKCQKKFEGDPKKYAGEKAQSSTSGQAGIGAP